ncbi:MAG TPA: metalloregulator ArsR/SmtB family transcription factor [Longimicrobiales bacterium]|nr:metalloregulator ArsR/SmtB family transcription factor [Longimicrobiales bacterium]
MNSVAPVLDHLSVVADAFRARTLAVLARQELTVSELCDVLQLPQSTVSRHLRMLADAGWVASRREGTSRYYSLPLDDLEPSRRQLWGLVNEQVARTAEAAQDEARLRSVLAGRRSKSAAFFSSAAHRWDIVRAELFGRDSHLPPLLALLDPGWVVGDLGCGTGQVSEALAPFVGRLIAVDTSGEMLEAARARLRDYPNVETCPGTLERLPLGDAQLDVGLLVLVLHHTADPGRVLVEAARVIRPGGVVLVADMLPHDHDEYRQTMGHVWLGFGERQMERWLAAAGFERMRWHHLPVEPGVKGPGLFAATARRTTFSSG